MRLFNLTGGKAPNYGWVVIGTLLVIDAIVMGVTFTMGIMLPVISDDLWDKLTSGGMARCDELGGDRHPHYTYSFPSGPV